MRFTDKEENSELISAANLADPAQLVKLQMSSQKVIGRDIMVHPL